MCFGISGDDLRVQEKRRIQRNFHCVSSGVGGEHKKECVPTNCGVCI